MHRFIFGLTAFLIPLSVQGAVTLHEVAWMGDLVSANHEWIELYNSGEAAVSLDGWTLTDGANLTITLQGTVASGAYAVLERTSDESAPGNAFLIYSGALVNTGATLQLRDAVGTLVDQVAGGEDWQGIGGDNETKETAQYTKSGWVTGAATPGQANVAGVTTPVTLKTYSAGTVAKPEVRGTVSLTRNNKPVLALAVNAPLETFVGQSNDLKVGVVGVGEQLSPSTKYQWNFGDTYTAEGSQVKHVYDYPGTYMITVRATVADRIAYHEQTVTVLPVNVSLSRNEAGDVQVHNDAVYAVDLSQYTLRGNKTVTFPIGTVIIPRATITVKSERIEAIAGHSLVVLSDQSGASMAHLKPTILDVSTQTGSRIETVSLPSTYAGHVVARSASLVETEKSVTAPFATPLVLAAQNDVAPGEDVLEVRARSSTKNAYYLGVLCIILGLIIALWSIPRKEVGPQNEVL